MKCTRDLWHHQGPCFPGDHRKRRWEEEWLCAAGHLQLMASPSSASSTCFDMNKAVKVKKKFCKFFFFFSGKYRVKDEM